MTGYVPIFTRVWILAPSSSEVVVPMLSRVSIPLQLEATGFFVCKNLPVLNRQ